MYNLIVLILIPLIFVSMIPFSSADKISEECKKVYSAHQLSLLERHAVYKICLDLANEDTKIFPAKVTRIYKALEEIVGYCDDWHPIFLMVDKVEFHNTMKRGATLCEKLYQTENYHETGPDRIPKIYKDVEQNLRKFLEESKEQRIKSVREARINQGQIMYVEDLFYEQENRIAFLEKQILEKENKIAENNLVINDQLDVINSLTHQIKNTALSLDENKMNIPKTILEDCFRNIDEKNISTIEKINELQQCSLLDFHSLVSIGTLKLEEFSQRAVDFCQENYNMYLQLGPQKYIKNADHQHAHRCVQLYEDPVWDYEGPDRNQVLLDFVTPIVTKFLEDSVTVRQQSVYDANMSKGRVMAMLYVFILQEEKIDALENILAEKNEQITKQEALMLEQLNTIQKLFVMSKTHLSNS